jgi:hypothetical protein
MAAEINAHLRQQTRLGLTRDYTVVEGKEIRISLQSKFKTQQFAVSLLALGEKSSYHIHVAWGWLVTALLAALMLSGYYYAKRYMALDIGLYEFVVVAVSGLLLLASVVAFGFNFSRKRVFYSRQAHIPLFDILINNPDQRQYRRFQQDLEACIMRSRQFWQLKYEQQMAGELRMIRRLVSEGVLDQSLYERAKEQLFRLSNKRAGTRSKT